MNNGVLAVVATAVGALIGFFGQEFHLWRQHRRRFDDVRQVAYTNLVAVAFRAYNEFAGTWSPFTMLYGRRKYLDLQNDVTGAVAAVRLVASRPVHEAAGELMDAVAGVVSFATDVLVKDAKFGIVGWYLLSYKPMPVAQNPGLKEPLDALGKATTRFVIAAQNEMRVPGKRQSRP